MPHSTVLTIFLASPGDVSAERAAADRVIQQLNVMFGSRVHLRLVRWETDVAPNVGTDPQAVVNEQIGDHYDILLGVFWGRIGTPTPRAPSGTVEEIEIALAKEESKPGSVAVMIYFKEDNLPPFDVDPDQLKAIQDLRVKLEKKLLSKAFKDTGSFERILLVDLYGTVERLLKKTNNATSDTSRSPEVPILPLSASDANDLALGYFDLLALHDEQMAGAIATLQSIKDCMESLTKETLKQNEKFSPSMSTNEAKAVFDTVGEHLSKFSDDLRRSTSQLGQQQRRGYNALIRAIVIGHEDGLMNASEAANLLETTTALIESYGSSMGGIDGLRGSINRLSRFTTRLIAGRNDAVAALDELLAEQNGGLGVLASIQERLSQVNQENGNK